LGERLRLRWLAAAVELCGFAQRYALLPKTESPTQVLSPGAEREEMGYP
jgi:hypothetical protein